MGPLAGIKVLEFEAIGPVPFAGMLLATWAPMCWSSTAGDARPRLEARALVRRDAPRQRSVTLDMKSAAGRSALALVARAMRSSKVPSRVMERSAWAGASFKQMKAGYGA